jgi:hypothetical protein
MTFPCREKSFVREILTSKTPEPGGGSMWRRGQRGHYIDAPPGDI